MRPILVIQCGNKKRKGVHRVRDLYLGPFWSTFRARDREAPVELDVFVLSAGHGLKHVDERLASYDCKLTPERVPVVGAMVCDQVGSQYPRLRGRPVHFVGNSLYREALEGGGLDVRPIFKPGDGLLGMRSALTDFLRLHGRFNALKGTGVKYVDLGAIMRRVRGD